jgi:hypothetical protein
MRYALLVYETPDMFERRKRYDPDEPLLSAWREYHRALVAAGVYVGGDPLHPPETATTVRVRRGAREIQDGPYASTKEQLAGFILLELPSLDAAIEWAARCPAAAIGAMEVRPLAEDVKEIIEQHADAGSVRSMS